MRHIKSLSAVITVCAIAGGAHAAGYEGPGLTADIYMGYEDTLQPMMRVYVGSKGARMVPFNPADDGPDLYIARLSEGAQYEIFLERRRAYREPMEEHELASARGDFCSSFATKTKTGAETVSGRQTEVWKCQGAVDGPDQVVWWDPLLKAEIRKSRAGLVVELLNIKVGQPDPQLFDVPAGVRFIY